MDRAILSLLVSNNFGVLTKVTGLFSRRGYNIKALSVGETEDPHISRITIVTEGDEQKLEQICRQVVKLEDVKTAKRLPAESVVQRELVLIKVCPAGEAWAALVQLVDAFSAKTVILPGGCAVIEASGTAQRMDELIEQARALSIIEMSRTGVTALESSALALSARP